MMEIWGGATTENCEIGRNGRLKIRKLRYFGRIDQNDFSAGSDGRRAANNHFLSSPQPLDYLPLGTLHEACANVARNCNLVIAHYQTRTPTSVLARTTNDTEQGSEAFTHIGIDDYEAGKQIGRQAKNAGARFPLQRAVDCVADSSTDPLAVAPPTYESITFSTPRAAKGGAMA